MTDIIQSIISSDLEIDGNIVGHGTIIVHGMVTGHITCGKLFLDHSGYIKGGIMSDDITISSSAECSGDIRYSVLKIEHGAKIDGTLNCLGEK